jgi:hypothetical protein
MPARANANLRRVCVAEAAQMPVVDMDEDDEKSTGAAVMKKKHKL